jgi:hypothetical protein
MVESDAPCRKQQAIRNPTSTGRFGKITAVSSVQPVIVKATKALIKTG